MGKLITYEMELDMEEGDSKKSKEVALQSVKKRCVEHKSCHQSLEDDLALFVTQFRRILKNKSKEVKRT